MSGGKKNILTENGNRNQNSDNFDVSVMAWHQ